MKEVRLKSLSLTAFRSFRDKATIEFPRSGTVLLRGTNHDTGGSSAAGKSSINLAIQHALGSSPFASTQLQSWLTEDPLQVDLELETPSGPLSIIRGKTLKLKVDGEKVGGAVKALEATITEKLGLSPEMLSALTYRGQRTRGSFLSKANQEAQEFLTQLLGLGRFEAAVEASKEQQKLLGIKAEAKRMSIASEEQTLEQLRSMLKEPDLIAPEVIQDLKSQILGGESGMEGLKTQLKILKQQEQDVSLAAAAAAASAASTFDELIKSATTDRDAVKAFYGFFNADTAEKTRLETILKQVQERSKTAKREDAARQQQQNEAWAAVKGQIAFLKNQIETRATVDKQRFELEYQVAVLESAKCPTCTQAWSQSQGRIPGIRAEIQKLEAELVRIDTLPPQLEELTAKAQELTRFEPSPLVEKFALAFQQVSNDLAKEEQRLLSAKQVFQTEGSHKLAEANAALSALLAQQTQARLEAAARSKDTVASISQQIREVQAQQMADQSQLARIWSELSTVEASNERQLADYNGRLELINIRQTQLDTSKTELQEIAADHAAEADFIAMVGPQGFLGAIFDEVLAEISDETNAILGSVPNTAQTTIAFKSESLTQKGTVKKSIVPVISVAGHEAPLASGLSGGQQAAVEFAVDLAVNAVVCRRLGVSPGWLILDECWEGLGPVEKEGALEILSKYAEDKLVLVIDHSSETKSSFASTIDIQCRNGVSSIV
jgi:DNA repair exonuclease SbcCD ATPase subunit